jgi:hypothetical protein
MEISLFVRVEEAPAFNFLIRVLTPVIYIIIVSAIFYALRLDKYVVRIYLVNFYYIVFRLLFNLGTNRGLLLNWYRQFLYWTAIITISYFAYDKIIKERTNLLPDFNTVSNELWIIVLIFLFQVFNNLRFSQDATIKRKENYIKRRFEIFKLKYGKVISDRTANSSLQLLVYAIMIYEDFNRPKIARTVENIIQKFDRKPHTLGVMQVRSDKNISDLQSVILGTERIVTAHQKLLSGILANAEEMHDYAVISMIISEYNGGSSYQTEIFELISVLRGHFKQPLDSLYPNKNIPPQQQPLTQ